MIKHIFFLYKINSETAIWALSTSRTVHRLGGTTLKNPCGHIWEPIPGLFLSISGIYFFTLKVFTNSLFIPFNLSFLKLMLMTHYGLWISKEMSVS